MDCAPSQSFWSLAHHVFPQQLPGGLHRRRRVLRHLRLPDYSASFCSVCKTGLSASGGSISAGCGALCRHCCCFWLRVSCSDGSCCFPASSAGSAGRWPGARRFSANGFFATNTRYFEPWADYNPLLHLWSLGVEEQFAHVWPLLLLLATRYGVTRPVLRAVIATSLVISIWGTRYAPAVHFYLPGSRAWELAVGGLPAARQLGTGARGDCGRVVGRNTLVLPAWPLAGRPCTQLPRAPRC